MPFVYLAALVFSLVGLGLLDYRHKLALFGGAPARTLAVVGISVAFFLVWDLVGIQAGVFFRGAGPWMTGIVLAPELPLEELLFLIVLSYSTLVAYLLAAKVLKSRLAA